MFPCRSHPKVQGSRLIRYFHASRGLEFLCAALTQNLNNPTEELSKSFGIAYEGTLKQYHNFVARGLFAAALKACPYRKDFYAKFGDDLQKVYAALKEYLAALEAIVAILKEFMTSPEAQWK